MKNNLSRIKRIAKDVYRTLGSGFSEDVRESMETPPKNEERYPVSHCRLITPESTDSLFYGLSKEEVKEVHKYLVPEKLPSGVIFYSLRNAVARFKLAKRNSE